MPTRDELLSATDDIIEDAVAHAEPMILRALLHQLTGDEDVVDMEVGTQVIGNFVAGCLAKESDIALVRQKAASFLKTYRDLGAPELKIEPSIELYRSLSLIACAELPEDERQMWYEQSALDPWARGLSWNSSPAPDHRAQFQVAIVGAGLSGLNAAVHLKRAGIPFVVIEKNAEVGGTWWVNKYPGARVDSPSPTYTHLFGVDFPYPYSFCPRNENLRYMRWVADRFDLRDQITFNTEIKSAIWDESAQKWELSAEQAAGRRTWKVNAVISCVGLLSRPRMPEIKGMDAFSGRACHTAQWPDDLDIRGKRVAIIGSGASSYQTTPVIAKTAAQTFLFQRTPSWCFDNPSYLKPLPSQALWLNRHFPFYVNFARFRLSWIFGPDAFGLAARIDPKCVDPHARSEVNKRTRDRRVAFIRQKLASRPDLVEKMIPKAPPLSSRPVIIDPEDSVYDALLRDNVALVTDAIEEITPAGVRASGREYPVDVIVYATGFRASDFLWPMVVRGRGGVSINDVWAKDGPRAYIGAMVPGFPNFFMSYGPNSNNFGGFQVIDLLEMEIRFALQCIAGLIEQRKMCVEVREEAYVRFNQELDRVERDMIYMDARAHSYYRSDFGRSCVNNPIDFRRMWRWLRDPAGGSMGETDALVRPRFGADLIVT